MESEALNPCSVGKMKANYDEMVRVRCKNCDKYFHCRGNYEAVHKCGGILQRTTAEILRYKLLDFHVFFLFYPFYFLFFFKYIKCHDNIRSDARELFGGNSSGKGKADSDADQVANR